MKDKALKFVTNIFVAALLCFSLLRLVQLFFVALFILNAFPDAFPDQAEPTLLGIKRGVSFEYNSTRDTEAVAMTVDGKCRLRVALDTGKGFDEIVEDVVCASGNGSIMSFLINGKYYIYKTHEMGEFKILGGTNYYFTDTKIDCEALLEDIGRIINNECPLHAVAISVSEGPQMPECGIYEGFGYRVEQLTNGAETEWQFYAADEKIFSVRWQAP